MEDFSKGSPAPEYALFNSTKPITLILLPQRSGLYARMGVKFIQKTESKKLMVSNDYAFRGIDHVQLAAPVGCEEKARHFYVDILGMEEIPKPENLRSRGGIWLRCGTNQIHIGVDGNFSPARKAHPAIVVENINTLRSRLELTGIETRDEEPLPGATRFYANDPFGNRLEFLEWTGL